MANDKRPHPEDRDERDVERDEPLDASETREVSKKDRPNPPRTTTRGWTSPKFGSSGSGGAELEPGPERD
ncbi:MAG: hypothetical protein DMD35_14150 [Gemmatimonadetes bacterium]|nr:MAG: hypothetical protein DMD35_14150 [Gemmatimonadota bacterium]